MKKGIEKARKMREWGDKKTGKHKEEGGRERREDDSLGPLIDRWLSKMEVRHYSEHTIKNRQWSLQTFARWAGERELRRPEQLTKPMLESYQRWLYHYRKENGKPLGVTTQHRQLTALRQFFKWLCKENYLVANPASELELPREPQGQLPKALSLEEVETILNVPDISDALGIRDRAMLEVFYATGIRRSELANLDLEDVERERGLLMIRQGKGKKDRVVPLGERALKWIERYLEITRPLLQVDMKEHALFISGFGQRFNAGYIGNWVHRVIKKADVGKRGSCHLFRHSCATHMLENGADIRFIQQLLGHANLDATQVYTELNIRQLREVHARTHPSAKLTDKRGDDGQL